MAPEIFVWPADKLAAPNDLGDTVRSLATEALTRILQQDRIHGYIYKASVLLAKHKRGVPWTNTTRQAALEEAMQFYTAAHPRNIPQLDTFFVPPILDELGLGWDVHQASHESPWSDETAPQQPQAVDAPADAVIAEPAPVGRPNADFCTLHNCNRMECFCWD